MYADNINAPGLRCGFAFLRRLGWTTTGRSPAKQDDHRDCDCGHGDYDDEED